MMNLYFPLLSPVKLRTVLAWLCREFVLCVVSEMPEGGFEIGYFVVSFGDIVPMTGEVFESELVLLRPCPAVN